MVFENVKETVPFLTSGNEGMCYSLKVKLSISVNNLFLWTKWAVACSMLTEVVQMLGIHKKCRTKTEVSSLPHEHFIAV